MSARDKFHTAVRNALIKEGWTITHDPFTVQFGIVEMHIDLGAEKVIAAEKGEQKIAVEIKSFLGASFIAQFHTALGQFLNYRKALAQQESERILYLAVPLDVHIDFFGLPFVQSVVQEHQLKHVVYQAEEEVITQWHH